MNPKASILVLIVVIALFIVGVFRSVFGDEPKELDAPPWAQMLGTWLAGEQKLDFADVQPRSSISEADRNCRDDLVQWQRLSLAANGSCGLFVSSSSASVRTLALRLEEGVSAELTVNWVDRDDRLTEEQRLTLTPSEQERLQFYEEGGTLVVFCSHDCTLALATLGPP